MTDIHGIEELDKARFAEVQRCLTAFNNAVGCDAYAPEVQSAARAAQKLSDELDGLATALRAAVTWADERADTKDVFADIVIPKSWRRSR